MKQITIIGLGAVGTSVGLALSEQTNAYLRIGCDLTRDAEKNAESLKAVDRIIHNVPSAVSEADIILLAIPAHEIRKTLEIIGSEVRKNALILECCPDKRAAFDWAKRYLPRTDGFIGIWPTVNREYLSEWESGHSHAHADLFRGGRTTLCVDAATRTDAIRDAEGLIRNLGAEPVFCDIDEMDGILAYTEQLPRVVSSSLFRTISERNTGAECLKAAGRATVLGAAPAAFDGSDEPASAILNNRENTIRALDDMIASLEFYRDSLKKKDGISLNGELTRVREAWRRWLTGETSGEEEKMPTFGSTLGQFLFGGLSRKRRRE